MSRGIILVLSVEEQVIAAVRAEARGSEVIAVSCLVKARRVGRQDCIVIDPRSVRACCLRRLRGWGRAGALREVVYLCLPAPPEVLLSLPQAYPGVIVRVGEIGAVFSKGPKTPPGRAAWARRTRILSPRSRGSKERVFLALAQQHAREGFAVPEAAAAIGLGVRRLHRLSLGWFGLPPGMVLALARVRRITRVLRITETDIGAIAEAHGFSDRRAMNRLLKRFLGISASLYRRRSRKLQLSETDTLLSENAPFPKRQDRRIEYGTELSLSSPSKGGQHEWS